MMTIIASFYDRLNRLLELSISTNEGLIILMIVVVLAGFSLLRYDPR